MSDSNGDVSSWVGRLLDGRYQVKTALGAGGMGEVYLARDQRMERLVVVKVPHASMLVDDSFRIRFTKEIRALTRLAHPGIVKALDAAQWDGPPGTPPVPYAVLEYLSGGSLRDRISAARGRLPIAAVVEWLPPVARALDFIHHQGVVHRDVKPGNILFDGEGHVFLADFGIAKTLDVTDTGVTQTGLVPGSPEYMAPEVATHGAQIGPAYDQYALAVVVFEALSGSAPHSAPNALQLAVLRATRPPRPLSTVARHVPAEAAAAVMRALSVRPADRFPTCGEFATAFVRGVASTASASSPPPQVPGPATLPDRSRADPRPPRQVNPPPVAAPMPSGATHGPLRALSGAPAREPSRLAAAAAPSRPEPRATHRGRWLVGAAVVVLTASAVLAPVDWRRLVGSSDPATPLNPVGHAVPVERSGPVSLVVESPVADAVVGDPLRVEGTLRAPASVEVRCAGRVGRRVADHFVVEEVTLSEGRADLIVEAYDGARRVAVDARSIVVDRTPPRIDLVAPSLREVLVRPDVTVEGRVVDAHLARLTVNGAEVIPGAEGRFACVVRFEALGTHTVVVRAVDALGMERSLERAVERRAERSASDRLLVDARARADAGDWEGVAALAAQVERAGGEIPNDLRDGLDRYRAPPELRIESPGDGAIISATHVVVRGTMSTARPKSDVLTVDGAVVPVVDGQFRIEVRVPDRPGPFDLLVRVRSAGVDRIEPVRLGLVYAPETWRVFLAGWAEPEGTERDPETDFPRRIRRSRDSAVMVLVPAGEYWRGASGRTIDPDTEADELPQTRVRLTRAYYLDEAEVSVRQFRAFVDATAYVSTAEQRKGEKLSTLTIERGESLDVAGRSWRLPAVDSNRHAQADEPVTLVSFFDAVAFSTWAGVGLPTEAQFERALRGGVENAIYPWGASRLPPRGSGNLADESLGRERPGFAKVDAYDDGVAWLAPVRFSKAGRFGLYDLVGNVLEWCADSYDPAAYGRGTVENPMVNSPSSKGVLRGSAWTSPLPGARNANRIWADRSRGFDYVGFRCAKALP